MPLSRRPGESPGGRRRGSPWTGLGTVVAKETADHLSGQVVRREKDDPRGTKYVVEGFATDGITSVGVVGRFLGSERYLIITIYEISKDQ